MSNLTEILQAIAFVVVLVFFLIFIGKSCEGERKDTRWRECIKTNKIADCAELLK